MCLRVACCGLTPDAVLDARRTIDRDSDTDRHSAGSNDPLLVHRGRLYHGDPDQGLRLSGQPTRPSRSPEVQDRPVHIVGYWMGNMGL